MVGYQITVLCVDMEQVRDIVASQRKVTSISRDGWDVSVKTAASEGLKVSTFLSSGHSSQ
jgi:hypothetical protein